MAVYVIALLGCSSDDGDISPDPDPDPSDKLEIILEDAIVVNPSGYAPLSALITLTLSGEARATLTVEGQDGPQSDIVQAFSESGSSLSVPVHGMYAGTTNTIKLAFFNPAGENLGTQVYEITTQPLSGALPQITIQEADRNDMAEGLTLVNYFGFNVSMFPQRPFMFDSYGKIRWYLDYSDHPELASLFYDDGPERLANGNLYFGSGGSNFGANPNNAIYEVDLFGNVINSWEMPGYGFHHEAFEKPNGNFIVTVNKEGAATIEDHIIEIDRSTGEIVNEWDLNESLQNTRVTWTSDTQDWFHANALYYDPTDDTIVVSGRTQGVVKLTASNEVVWLLAPHRGWGESGSGIPLAPFLLQPLDSEGANIVDNTVLEGSANHPDFEWPWYQHAPLLLPNGEVMLFDNGDNRNYTGSGPYSRAVSYRIDPVGKTVQQQWQYGKERGDETYSRIVSDVDYLEAYDHVLFSPGAIQRGGANYGKSIEVDRTTGEVVFEATITPPQAFAGIITFHRTERMPLYPD